MPATGSSQRGTDSKARAPRSTAIVEADDVERFDLAAAAIVGAAAAALFAATFSANVAMGDAPESVSGVHTLGILHAPGYPMYALAARVFGSVVALGSWSLRTNLFSLVCAALTISITFLVARLFGARRSGAAIASLGLATAASFWFDADFAKHYAFSGLLLTGALLAALWWQHGAADAWLVGSSVLLAAGAGAAWELAGIMLVGVVALVALGPRRPSLTLVAITAGAVVGVVVLVGVYVITRAGAHPAVDWGGATSVSRLFELLRQADFQNQAGAAAGGLASAPNAAVTYVAIMARDTGLVFLVLAVIGGITSARRLRRDQRVFIAIVVFGNLAAVAVGTGISVAAGFFTGLVTGGFVLDLLFVVTILTALGIDASADFLTRTLFEAERPARGGTGASDARAVMVGLIGVAVILPSLLAHHHVADHRSPPLADRYGSSVLDALPHNSVLLVGGYEYAEPELYRQIVHGQRRDVTVVSADLLALPWYREQVTREIGASWHPPAHATNAQTAIDLAQSLTGKRPVYLDATAMQALGNRMGYRAEGLVGRVVSGQGPQRGNDTPAVAAQLEAADVAGGLDGTAYEQFPNYFLYYFHERAHIELAKQYALANDRAGATTELQRAIAIEPSDGVARGVYNLMVRNDPRAPELLRSL